MGTKANSSIYQADFTVWGETFAKQLKNRRESFDNNRDYHAWQAGRFRKAQIASSAAATIFIGSAAYFTEIRDWLSTLALIATTLSGAMQTWAANSAYRRLVAFYAAGATRLWQIQRIFDHVEKMPDRLEKQQAMKRLYESFEECLIELDAQYQREGEAREARGKQEL